MERLRGLVFGSEALLQERQIDFDAFKDLIDGKILKEMIPEIKSEYKSFFRSIAGDLITNPAPKK